MQSQKGVPDCTCVFMFEVHITICILSFKNTKTKYIYKVAGFIEKLVENSFLHPRESELLFSAFI